MADARERLRVLGLRAIDLRGGGGKSHEAMTPQDVAASLAGLDRGAYLLGMLVWAGHSDLRDQVLDHLELEVAALVAGMSWRTSPRVVAGLARLLLRDALGEPHCNACRGKGLVYKRGGVVEECKGCGGLGLRPLSDREKARTAGIGSSYWARVWRGRYPTLRGIVAGMESRLLAHVRRKLR